MDGLYDPQFEHDACGVGFVVQIDGTPSHAIVQQALDVLANLKHRGASGSDAHTGDGAGILIQMPDAFLRAPATRLGFALPPRGCYGAGLIFLPHVAMTRHALQAICERVVCEEGQEVLGWRDVPTDHSQLGPAARAAEPVFAQFFIGIGRNTPPEAFERKLFVIRKRIEHLVDRLGLTTAEPFYIVSLSSQTLIYKGMLTASQISTMFPDLLNPALTSALALVHQRFSTNTFPSWPLAHPYRLVAHNGEINTLRGNVNWMRAREALLESATLGEDLARILPVIREGGSDTAVFDNVLELLVMSGRSLPHAILMMIPEPWQGHTSMDPALRAFYEYHASLMEPWDGPASIAFTDGAVIGAILDRNGLRPSRYYVTTDGLVIMASEVGVLDIAPERILLKERLHPGRMFLVDTAQGRIIDDTEVKRALADAQPYQQWLDDHAVRLEDLPDGPPAPRPAHDTIAQRQAAFGYTDEDLRLILAPMAMAGEEALGSMGTDTPLAVLSRRPRLLFDYFSQLFAQVTNPPLDAIREKLVTSMASTIGPEGNLLKPTPASCRQIAIASVVIDNDALMKLSHLPAALGRACTLPMLCRPDGGGAELTRALDQLCADADAAVADGCTMLILSDRGVHPDAAAIPSVLATAAVHHHLVRRGTRTRCALVVECGDAREVHHMALLIGYGAGAVNPYLALDTIADLHHQATLNDVPLAEAVRRYLRALDSGLLKVMSKMGISTVQSYRGAQMFEALGLEQAVVDAYFTHTTSRIGGIGLDVLAEEGRRRHQRAFLNGKAMPALDAGGEYQWRRDGEPHLFTPEIVQTLQHATRSGQYAVYRRYTDLVNTQSHRDGTLRGLMTFTASSPTEAGPIDVSEVEPVESLLRRFSTGAMSYGSISQEAHETLAIAMNRLGGRSNTGEGGEDPARNIPDANGDSRRSAIKQVASGRFGVTSEYLVNADDLQIKMAQGAKPGEGGQLPGHKVYPWIAKVRHATPGVTLISPPPHHDIYSIEDLAQLIYDLRNANPRARVHVKLVAQSGVGTVAAGVAKAMADVVLISGHDGGTGAAPLTALKHSGVPWELGLAEAQQVLIRNQLRDRIVVQVDGQMKTGRDVVIAALLGAEEFGFATAPLVVSGCVMMRVCHLNTCPVGIATQDPALRTAFTGTPEFVEQFFRFIAEDVRETMAKLGFRTIDEMVGRVDRLNTRDAVDHWKTRGIDLSRILCQPTHAADSPRRRTRPQDPGTADALDHQLIRDAQPALDDSVPVSLHVEVRNADRAVGTMLGGEVTRRYGAAGLPDSTITVACHGSAGQSFGAFLPRGITLSLHGDANDGWGKGLSGGRIAVRPPTGTIFAAEGNVIIGNVALYGATSGEAYVNGIAGERFAVRNSGAHAVVEGVGDHGCEYMTEGRVLVLGAVGRNFAAGMSGGFAYVFDPDRVLESRSNRDMVDLVGLNDTADVMLVHAMLSRHVRYTGSALAMRLLSHWTSTRSAFVKVAPREYARARASSQADEGPAIALRPAQGHSLEATCG